MSLTTVERSANLPAVRDAIRQILMYSPDYQRLDPATRLAIARGLVRICATAIDLNRTAGTALAAPDENSRDKLVRAQSAGSEFSGVAADRVASTTQQILNAVSFPRFVTELINGVFKALVDSNQQQLTSYVDLIRNVSASLDGFAQANVGLDGARQWLVERFPGSFIIEGETDPFAEPGQPLSPEEQAELDAERRLRLRPGASMPSEAALRAGLGLGPNESVPSGDPENLVALARSALARNRQQMLSTMVMLGLQRIVIESGRLHASMRFHIDTRSAAQDDRASQFDARHSSTASGSFGYGPWGASATMTNTIGYVSSQKTQTTEEMNTDLDLNSSVELVFKTDYVPLDRLAGREQVDRIKVHTLNPDAEMKAAGEAREAREKRISESESKRWAALDKTIAAPPAPPPAPKAGEPGSPEAADKARREAQDKDKSKEKKPEGQTQQGQTQQGQTQQGQTQQGQTQQGQTQQGQTQQGQTQQGQTQQGQTQQGQTQQGQTQQGQTQQGQTQQGQTQQGKAQATTKSTDGAGDSKAKTKAQSLGLEGDFESFAANSPRTPDVIYAPTLREGIDEILELAQVTSRDVLYDLGCGDGRIVVTAAARYGCHAVGFDIDPKRVAESRENVRRNGLSNLVRIEERDIFDVDLSRADVVTLYLLPNLNVRLVPQIAKMRPGARIVSQDFDMAGVIPDRVVQVFLAAQGFYKTFYLWITPLKFTSVPVPHEWSNAKGITA